MFTTREKIFLVTSILYIVYALFPLFSDITGIPVEIPSMLAVLVLLILYPRSFINHTTMWGVIYLFLLLVYFAFGKELTIGIGSISDGKKIIVEAAFILPSIAIFNILSYLKKTELYRAVAISSLVILAVSFVYILPVLIFDGDVLRVNNLGRLEVKINGLPSYPLMHAYTMVVAALLYGIKVTGGKIRMLFLAMTVLIAFVIFRTYVTTSLILLVFLLLAVLAYKEGSPLRTFFVSGIIAFLGFYFVSSGLMKSFITSVEPVFYDTAVEQKVEDLKVGLSVGDYEGESFSARENYHEISRQSFYENVFIGNVENDIHSQIAGGHSAVLDRLAGFGLLGFIPFFMIFFASYKEIYRMLVTERSKFYLLLGAAVSLTFLYMKGLFGYEGWLMTMVVMPSSIIYLHYCHELESLGYDEYGYELDDSDTQQTTTE